MEEITGLTFRTIDWGTLKCSFRRHSILAGRTSLIKYRLKHAYPRLGRRRVGGPTLSISSDFPNTLDMFQYSHGTNIHSGKAPQDRTNEPQS